MCIDYIKKLKITDIKDLFTCNDVNTERWTREKLAAIYDTNDGALKGCPAHAKHVALLVDIEYLKGSNKRKGILTFWHSWKKEGFTKHGS